MKDPVDRDDGRGIERPLPFRFFVYIAVNLLFGIGLPFVVPMWWTPMAMSWGLSHVQATWLGFGIGLVILMALATWALLGARREWAQMRETGGLACPRCLHDLRDTAPNTPCPECGRVFEPEKDLYSWERRKLAEYQAARRQGSAPGA